MDEGTTTSPDITSADMRKHVTYLASDELEGRLTGTDGERKATQYAADVFASLGLEPAGDQGTWFQEFEFTAGVSLGQGNHLTIARDDADVFEPEVNVAWRPLAFSRAGVIQTAPVVFAGYGIVAPADEGQTEYDSYTHLDVEGKWVLILRFMPERIAPERRQFFNRYASLRHKAMVARDHGAVGMIVVNGPNADAKEALVALRFDASLAGSSIAALSVTNDLADRLLAAAGRELKAVQEALDDGEPTMGFELPGVTLEATVDVQFERKTGRNVLARLSDGIEGNTAVVVGAHIDHLGYGGGNQSMARGDEEGRIHYGADDNASGTAGLLEIAEFLTQERREGRLDLKHDIVFAAWSGEELGILGSGHFTRVLAGEGEKARGLPLSVSSYFNMDMIGRFKDQVLVHGVGSSSIWPQEIERANASLGLPVTMQNDPYIPTDSTSFYGKGVPFLNAFTGLHGEYHTPRDTPEKIDYEMAAKIAQFMGRLAMAQATREEAPDYQPMAEPEKAPSGGLRAYLGTIPDYAETDAPGVKLSGVAKGGPADRAGVLGGDSIVELAGKSIENVYDYTYAIQALKIGEPVALVVLREGKRIAMTVTPGSRE